MYLLKLGGESIYILNAQFSSHLLQQCVSVSVVLRNYQKIAWTSNIHVRNVRSLP